MISSIGLIVPSTFETAATATIFVRPVSSRSSASSRSRPSSVIGMWRTTAAGSLGRLIPGHEIRVVLHLAGRISSPGRRLASPQLRATRLMECVVPEVKTICSVVAGLSSSRAAGRVEECPHLFPGGLVERVGLFGQHVDAAMDVRVVLPVDIHKGVDHLPRPLGGGRVVEVDQRHVGMDLAAEDGKIGPKRLGLETGGGRTLSQWLAGPVHGRFGRRSCDALRLGRRQCGRRCLGDGRPAVAGDWLCPTGWHWLCHWQRGIDRRLQHPPAKQAAFLPVGRKPDPEQVEHVLGGEPLHVVNVFAVELLDQHRGGRLADAAAVAVEIDLLELALVVDLQFHPNHVAAQRIRVLVRVRAAWTPPAMVRLLVIFLDAILINVFLFHRHSLAVSPMLILSSLHQKATPFPVGGGVG